VNWHVGFASAGVGMALGLIQLALGRHYLKAAVVRLGAATALAGSPAGDEPGPARAVGGPMISGAEWKRIAAIAIFFLFGILFFAGYEQAGSTLNLFTDRYTRLEAFGFAIPSSWFQSIQPLFVILLTPLFAWTWTTLGAKQPSISGKFALGLFFMGMSYFVLVPAGAIAQAGEGIRVSPWWIVVSYAISEFGEICLYPVGMSAVTKLAPPRIVGLMMGVWFLAIAFGNKLAGWVAGFIETMPLQTIFGLMTAVLVAAAVVMTLLIKPVSRLTGEAR
jgi:POT family proton-dependent oligopeptide transporter